MIKIGGNTAQKVFFKKERNKREKDHEAFSENGLDTGTCFGSSDLRNEHLHRS